MNRRRAIISLSVAGAGIAAAFSGFKWYQISKAPDLAFLDQQTSLIAALAETMIPATDTPGAKDTLVHEFILKMIKDCTGKKTQNNFIDG
ncbi:MAG: gluconate 2-dehydrogenase subunit 3 family protein, partial [Chitinophagaceae bacterium]|nr:gluconate 2-dehydrogenase subunit 3 family protein [Chitinophagaceae bacterium]